MYPDGLFGLDSLRLLISPIAIACNVFLILYLRREGVNAWRVVLLLLLAGIAALLGAKLFSLLVRGWQLYQPLSHELRGGWRYPGALLALLVALPLFKHWIIPQLPLLRLFDAFAIVLCLGLGMVRVSCYMNGCCTGPECDAIYCISYEPGSAVWYQQYQLGLLAHASHASHPVLPLHFLFMAASFGVGIFLMWFDPRRNYNGQTALLFLALHEGAKALLESFREPYILQLQLASAVVFVLALLALIVLRRRKLTTVK